MKGYAVAENGLACAALGDEGIRKKQWRSFTALSRRWRRLQALAGRSQAWLCLQPADFNGYHFIEAQPFSA